MFFRLLTFSAGRRVCPGEVLARNRLFLVIANVLQKLTIEPEDENRIKQVINPLTFEPRLTLYPQAYKVKVNVRSSKLAGYS